MNRSEAKEIAKTRLQEYLQRKGINARKPFRCLSHDHEDKNPSMSYDSSRNRVKCFGCNANYDIFDLVGNEYGISDEKAKFDKVYEILNLTVEDTNDNFSLKAKTLSVSKPVYTRETDNKKIDYSTFYQEANSNIDQKLCADYLTKRGISIETAKRYNLGYMEQWTLPQSLQKNTSDGKPSYPSPRLIIPASIDHYTAINVKTNQKLKIGKVRIFNIEATTEDKPCFVVESELDALSFLEHGFNAVSVGSTSYVDIFCNALQKCNAKSPLVIALDNDNAGKEASARLEDKLTKINIKHFTPEDIYHNYKDANEFLQNDKKLFVEKATTAIHSLQEEIDINLQASIEAEEIARQEYQKITAYSAISDFQNYIQSRRGKKYISTGFEQLDDKLGNSLFEGLYAIGAISSLGKTTFILQIADHLAKQGQDVLYCSLEMSKYELMGKSISRETSLHCAEHDIDTRNAKTIRGILDGRRYDNYREEDKKVIQSATDNYKAYSSNLYIHEGIGDIGVEKIKSFIEEHIKFTGNTPILIIDYLQIIAPDNPKATDKQNTDKAVLELKRISRDFKTPVIVVSSLNRASYKESITMDAFKESGAIEYSSDVLIGLQLKGAGNKNFDVDAAKKAYPREIELKILKNRNGETGSTIEYQYYPMFNVFSECNKKYSAVFNSG